MEYFNSSGAKPSEEVQNWLHKTKDNIEKKTNKKVEIVLINKYELQKSTSECGLFALWYIYSRLNDVPYEFFLTPDCVDDKMMFQFRKSIFRSAS